MELFNKYQYEDLLIRDIDPYASAKYDPESLGSHGVHGHPG